MKKTLITLSILAVLALALVFAGCSGGGTPTVSLSQQQQGIWVSGNGEVQVEPDIFNLSLGIVAQEPNLSLAQDRATVAMEDVLAVLKDKGVDDNDIQTSRFSVRQVTRWDREKEENVVTGYEVSHMVNVKVREIDQAGSIIDAVSTAGGDLTRINSMGFAIEDDTEYKDQARELAIAEARAKAEQLAKFSGVKLGRAIYVTETAQALPVVYRSFAEAPAAAPIMEGAGTSIVPGELTVSVMVQIVYEID